MAATTFVKLLSCQDPTMHCKVQWCSIALCCESCRPRASLSHPTVAQIEGTGKKLNRCLEKFCWDFRAVGWGPGKMMKNPETTVPKLMGDDLAERIYNPETVILELMGDDQVEQMTIPQM